MRPLSKVVGLAGVFVLSSAWVSGQIGVVGVQAEPKTTKSARGGLLAKSERNRFEVFFYPTGLRVFPLDFAGTPVDVSKLTGTATFYHPNSPKPWFSRPLQSATVGEGQGQASLDLVIGLSAVPSKGAKVTFEIAGLPDSGASSVVATVPFEFAAAPASTNPTPPPDEAATCPRYVYGPGYYGFGYYWYPGPQDAPAAASAPSVYSYGPPYGRSSRGGSGATHDWSTGRDLPSGGLISKPWLRPMD